MRGAVPARPQRLLVPPRGGSGGSDAQPKYEFVFETWIEGTKSTAWSRNTYNDGGYYQKQERFSTDTQQIKVMSSTEDQALQQTKALLAYISPVVETGESWSSDKSKTTQERKFKLISVTEV